MTPARAATPHLFFIMISLPRKQVFGTCYPLFFIASHCVLAQTNSSASTVSERVEINAPALSNTPLYLPATSERIDANSINNSINATDSSDALKYFPSLTVRKRYAGDYDHAVLATRASGTNNSARSSLFVDGMSIANFLGNGASFTPRWGLINPFEIASVDVI
ncbi:MAG: hypothetical protein RLZZ502_708 [Pseudomonadota bacterium]|jgi:iron complex outermembrane receptor protein